MRAQTNGKVWMMNGIADRQRIENEQEGLNFTTHTADNHTNMILT